MPVQKQKSSLIMYMNKPIISFVIGFILLAFFITDEMRMLLQFIDICYTIHFSKVTDSTRICFFTFHDAIILVLPATE